MSNSNKDVATIDEATKLVIDERAAIQVGSSGQIVLKTVDELYRFSAAMSRTALGAGRKPEDIMAAIQFGTTLGFTPMQSLQGFPVIKGRVRIEGRHALAVIRARCPQREGEDIRCGAGVIDGVLTGWCKSWRKEWPEPRLTVYDWNDAVLAKLSAKDTYKQFPKEMLKWKAVSRHADDEYTEIVTGLVIGVEADDIEWLETAREVNHNELVLEEIENSHEATPVDPLLTIEAASEAEVVGPAEAVTDDPVPYEGEFVAPVEKLTREEFVERFSDAEERGIAPEPEAPEPIDVPCGQKHGETWCMMEPGHDGLCDGEEEPPELQDPIDPEDPEDLADAGNFDLENDPGPVPEDVDGDPFND